MRQFGPGNSQRRQWIVALIAKVNKYIIKRMVENIREKMSFSHLLESILRDLKQMGHFRVDLCLGFEVSLGAQLFLGK